MCCCSTQNQDHASASKHVFYSLTFYVFFCKIYYYIIGIIFCQMHFLSDFFFLVYCYYLFSMQVCWNFFHFSQFIFILITLGCRCSMFSLQTSNPFVFSAFSVHLSKLILSNMDKTLFCNSCTYMFRYMWVCKNMQTVQIQLNNPKWCMTISPISPWTQPDRTLCMHTIK